MARPWTWLPSFGPTKKVGPSVRRTARSRHTPLNTGARLATNASTPSVKSLLV